MNKTGAQWWSIDLALEEPLPMQDPAELLEQRLWQCSERPALGLDSKTVEALKNLQSLTSVGRTQSSSTSDGRMVNFKVLSADMERTVVSGHSKDSTLEQVHDSGGYSPETNESVRQRLEEFGEYNCAHDASYDEDDLYSHDHHDVGPRDRSISLAHMPTSSPFPGQGTSETSWHARDSAAGPAHNHDGSHLQQQS
jgi:hypothetical protein